MGMVVIFENMSYKRSAVSICIVVTGCSQNDNTVVFWWRCVCDVLEFASSMSDWTNIWSYEVNCMLLLGCKLTYLRMIASRNCGTVTCCENAAGSFVYGDLELHEWTHRKLWLLCRCQPFFSPILSKYGKANTSTMCSCLYCSCVKCLILYFSE